MPRLLDGSPSGRYLLYLAAFFTLLTTISASPVVTRQPFLSRRQETAMCESPTSPDCCDINGGARRWALPSLQYESVSYDEVPDDEVAYSEVSTDSADQDPSALIIAEGGKKNEPKPEPEPKKHGAADNCGPYQKPCCTIKSTTPVPDSSSPIEPVPLVPNRHHVGSTR